MVKKAEGVKALRLKIVEENLVRQREDAEKFFIKCGGRTKKSFIKCDTMQKKSFMKCVFWL